MNSQMSKYMSTGPLPRGAEGRVCLLVAAFFPSVELPALGTSVENSLCCYC